MMRPWIKRTVIGMFGAGIMLGGLSACGHRPGHHGYSMSAEDRMKMRERIVERASAKLDLTVEQRQKLQTLADRLDEQRTALMGGKDPRVEMQALVVGEKFDRSKAASLVSEKTATLSTKSPELISALGDFYDSLNPTQQARVREFMQHRHGWRRG